MSTIDPAELVLSVFCGRRDVVPKFWTKTGQNGSVRSGYAPICSNFWTDACPKKSGQKAACDKCPAKSYTPMSAGLLQGHFDGKDVLGVFPLLPDGTCWFLAADFDDHAGNRDPLADVQAYAKALEDISLTPYVLRSKSGRGYHVYVFFSAAVPAWKARRVAFSCLKEAKLIGDDIRVNSFDRLFPNQDELGPKKPLGNQIAMPFQGKACEQGHTLLLDPADGYITPYADQLAVLQGVARATEEQLEAVIQARGLTKEDTLSPAKAAAAYAPRSLPSLIPQSQRNDTLFKATCSLQARGMADSAIRAAMHAENREKCVPPLDTAEVDVILDNALSKYPKSISAPAPKASSTNIVAPPGNGLTQAGNSAPPAPTGGVRILSMLPGAPVDPRAEVPSSILLSTTKGIEVLQPDDKGVVHSRRAFPSPVLVSERLKCVHTSQEQVKVIWYSDGVWQSAIVERRTVASNIDILFLANLGVPVHSDNKVFLSRFLCEYLDYNKDAIPLLKVTDRFGYQRGLDVFLWGNYLITENMISLTGSNFQGTLPDVIVFKGKDAGDDQIAEGFHSHGDYGHWVAIAGEAISFPIPFTILMASFAPAVLEIVGGSNFVVETAGVTSRGKTTTQRLAASVWGCPDERAEASVLHTWDATKVWIERAGGLLNGLPLVLDDTKRVFSSLPRDQARAKINDVVYSYASGKGRGRGSETGTQRTGSFRSVLISSGEEPCVDSSSEHGGARARVLSLWGAPFGDVSNPDLVRRINEAVCENYGFAGPALVQHLLREKKSWPALKARHKELLAYYTSLAGPNNVAARLSEIFAVLELVAEQVAKVLPTLTLKQSARDILKLIWDGAVKESAISSDRALAAMRDIWEWASANQTKFVGRAKQDTTGNVLEPVKGWLGRWDKDANWSQVAFMGTQLRAQLKTFGYDVSATLRTWNDRGWLATDNLGRNQKHVVIEGSKVSCYCLKRTAIESELGIEAEPELKKSISPFSLGK